MCPWSSSPEVGAATNRRGGGFPWVRVLRPQAVGMTHVDCTSHQVRSVASETAIQHAASPVGVALDWYALDLNEELSAFDGVYV